MARRADHTPDQLRDLIVSAARDIIVSDGIRSLSTRAIASKIGYTSGTLYQHFADIKEIILHVNSLTMQGLVDQMLTNQVADDDPRSRIHRYADIYIEYIRGNRNAWDAMFDYRRAPDEKVPAWYIGQIEKLISLVEDCFARLDVTGKGITPSQASRLLWASVHSVCTLEGGGRLEFVMREDLEVLIHRLVNVHINSFVFGPSRP